MVKATAKKKRNFRYEIRSGRLMNFLLATSRTALNAATTSCCSSADALTCISARKMRELSFESQSLEIVVNARQAIAFVKRHGIVLQAARGPVPSLAAAIAGEPIRGSWWGHPKGRIIFQAAQAICESPEILVCKLIDGKVTYVHRRVWPALVKLAPRFRKEQLAKVWDEHTASGAHESKTMAFPEWVPADVIKEAEALSAAEAEQSLSVLLANEPVRKNRKATHE
jgi:hypothetical protein